MKKLYIAAWWILVSTPAWAGLTTGGAYFWAGVWLSAFPLICLVHGARPIAGWAGIPAGVGFILALWTWGNFDGTNPRFPSVTTYQAYYEISENEQERLQKIYHSDECKQGGWLPTSDCTKAYADCEQFNLCKGLFQQVYVERARELKENPNAFSRDKPCLHTRRPTCW